MSEAPKHADPDPATELSSGHSGIDPRDFRNALGTYATGVTIIPAAGADGRPVGITCNSFASVSLNPPLVLWSLGMFSQSLSAFQNASHFAVNVLALRSANWQENSRPPPPTSSLASIGRPASAARRCSGEPWRAS